MDLLNVTDEKEGGRIGFGKRRSEIEFETHVKEGIL